MSITPTPADRLAVLDEMPDTATKAEIEAEVARRAAEAIPKDLRFGDRVRSVNGHVTGRYLGIYGGKDLVGWVSAQDNDLMIGEVAAGAPHPSLPVPSDEALAGMCVGLSSGYGNGVNR